MGISRREFFLVTAGVGLGVALSNKDKIVKGFLSEDNLLAFRIEQTADYVQWLRRNGLLEKFRLKAEGVAWERNQALIALNQEGKPELIIPYRPVIKYLEIIGVKKEEKKVIRLVYLKAELANIKEGREVPGPVFFSANLFFADRLAKLPPVEYGFSPKTILWTSSENPYINSRALRNLQFQVVFNHAMLSNTPISFVEDDSIFSSPNRLGPWSSQLARVNVEEIASRNFYTKPDDVAKITSVARSNGAGGLDYYLI